MSDRRREQDPRANGIDERDLEALAHGRSDLASESAREAASTGGALAARIEREREASREASVALKRAAPELDDLDAMISAAMAHAPESAVHRGSAPEGAPSRTSLAIGAAIGALVALGSGVLSIAASDPRALAIDTVGDLSSGARLAVTLGTALDRISGHVPGGWAALAIAGLVLVGALLIPLRAIARPGGRAGTAAAALALAVLTSAGVARAYEIEGEWPGEDARVRVDVDRAPRSEALLEACRSAGLGLAYSLESDEPVTLHVEDAPLREVLDAILGDEPARVRHTGHLIVIRPAAVPAVPVVPAPGAPAEAPPPPPVAPVAQPPAAPVAQPPATRPTLALPAPELRDLVTFGGDARVLAGQQVRDVITMGGDARVEGHAFGDVVTMGGDVDVGGTVVGDVVTMGGDIRVAREGRVHGQLNAMGGRISVDEPAMRAGGAPAHPGIRVASGRVEGGERTGPSWIGETLDALMKHALLFLLGLVFIGLAPARVAALQRQIVQQPLRALASGFLGTIATAVLTVVLVITIVGIPGAIVLALGAFLAAYAGLATTAQVIGAALPIPALKEKPVLQLAAGVLALFVVSRVPIVGPLIAFLAMMIGLGAVVITRAGQRPG